MKEYPKINSIFKRDEATHKFLIGQWSQPEFEYLANNTWEFTEKVDGTNIRIMWNLETVRFGGKTDNAQIPTFLLAKLQDLFPVSKFQEHFPETPLCLYGEGYGARIQKGGGNYISTGVDFVLFDVLIESWWLQRKNTEDIAEKLGLQIVPIVDQGTIQNAIGLVTDGLQSVWGNFQAEGLVLRPTIGLQTRSGQRIITKLKHRDF